MNEARAVSDLGATLCELVEIKSELRLAGREARFERPHACGEFAEEHVMHGRGYVRCGEDAL